MFCVQRIAQGICSPPKGGSHRICHWAESQTGSRRPRSSAPLPPHSCCDRPVLRHLAIGQHQNIRSVISKNSLMKHLLVALTVRKLSRLLFSQQCPLCGTLPWLTSGNGCTSRSLTWLSVSDLCQFCTFLCLLTSARATDGSDPELTRCYNPAFINTTHPSTQPLFSFCPNCLTYFYFLLLCAVSFGKCLTFFLGTR